MPISAADRLTKLREFLTEEPQDPFNRYALATELLSQAQIPEALGHFRQLLTDHPSYLATYYHAAALLADLDQPEAARIVYEKGIELAQQQGETKTLRELQAAYQNFLFEQDDD